MPLHKLPEKKYAHQAFKAVYGINHCTANKIIGLLRLHPRATFPHLLKPTLKHQLTDILGFMYLDFRLRLIVFSRLCLLIATGSYRGLRLLQGLPMRGQRTHANGKTPKHLKSIGKHFPFKIKAKVSTTESQSKYKKKEKKGGVKQTKTKAPKLKGKAKAKAKAKAKVKAKAKKAANKKA